jgi:hypothetical protein
MRSQMLPDCGPRLGAIDGGCSAVNPLSRRLPARPLRSFPKP